MAHSPFDKLKDIKIVKKPASPGVKTREGKGKAASGAGSKGAPAPAPPPPEPEDESQTFARAMAGVAPLDGEKTKGRVVHPVDPPAPLPPGDPDAEALSLLRDALSGGVEFALEFTDEYVQGYVKDLDLKFFRQLKAGSISPQAHLDLHGHNAAQAKDSVIAFIKAGYLSGKRCLLLITGRGVNSPGGLPVLKEEIKSWLTRDPLKRVVLAFCTARARHGGAGALYVLLRARKKMSGRVRFENRADDGFFD